VQQANNGTTERDKIVRKMFGTRTPFRMAGPREFVRAFALASALATTVISYVLEQLAASIFRVVQQHFIFNTLPENLFCNFDNPIEFHSHEVVHTCQYHCFNKICLMRSFAGLSRRRFGFDPRPVHVRFVVDKVAL